MRIVPSPKPTPDPPVDGTCVVCGKERTLPERLQRGVPVIEYEKDPFCSNVCAKLYFETEDTPMPPPGRPRTLNPKEAGT